METTPQNNPSSTDNLSEPTEEKSQLLSAAKKIVEQREYIPHTSQHKPKKKKPEKFNPAQIGMFAGIVLFVVLLLAGLVRSCNYKGQPAPRFIDESSLLPATVMYGGEKLPGKVFVGMEAVRTVKNKELVSEIKKVIDESGTPSDVFKNEIPAKQNVASTLSKQFEIYQKNPGELEILRQVLPFENGKVSEESLSKVSDILPRIDAKRQQIRQMLNQEDVCFTFEFTTLPKDAGNQAGTEVPETKAADFLADYAMLEDFSIAEALKKGDTQSASESLAYIFRLAQLAAEVKNPIIRIKAGEIRLKAVDTLQNVVLDPHLNEENLVYLFSVVQEQLNAWTPDSSAWVGDRASGMKVYNLIFQYGLEEALEPEEIEEMIVRGIYNDVAKNLHKTLPRDQVFYLQSMQKIIDICGEPFYRRMPVLNQIDDALRFAQGTSEETVISEFLLRGVRDIMQFCAQDRTKCEMAALAMAYSLRKTKYPFPATEGRNILPAKTMEMLQDCPLYGKKYELKQSREPRYRIEQEADNTLADKPAGEINTVSVSYPGSLQPFRVPDFSVSP